MDGLNTAYLLLGGNLGDVKETFIKAIEGIDEFAEIKEKSGIYRSEPWGFESEHDFLNQVLLVRTGLSPKDFLRSLLEVEQKLGRETKRHSETGSYQSRLIDIDLLFYEDYEVSGKDLTVPHPKLHERRFTLLPLAQIAPDFIHPSKDKTISQLLLECDDNAEVKEI